MNLPKEFLDRLKIIIPQENREDVLRSFNNPKEYCLRVNTLKLSEQEAIGLLQKENILFEKLGFPPQAFLIDDKSIRPVRESFLISEGLFYKQNPSSMIIPLILDPQPGERVLDMCAAPGSKTTQMAAMMKGEGEVVAVESVKNRFYKLKSVAGLLGAPNIQFLLQDARRFRPQEKFDKILLDAPCSSEGRFRADDKKSIGYWSRRKIKEMQKKQKGLLHHALRLLEVGGILVYSTCTFAPEENEEVVDWVLRKMHGEIELEKISLREFATYRPLLKWGNKEFDHSINKCLRILPDNTFDAFFAAKIKRISG